MGRRVRVKAPATVSNLNCGFDVLGLAINGPFDTIGLELTETGRIEIADVRGCDTLSRDPAENVVGPVLRAMATAIGVTAGFRVIIEKGIHPGSGIGSSAASSAATAYAANLLFDNAFSLSELVGFAMEGERLASGALHADNVAPSLLGGITLVRSYEPLDIVRLHVPPELFVVVILPDTEVKTSVARGLLDRQLPLQTAVRQWGNVGGLVAGLYSEDYELISRSLEDFVAEPRRAGLIPGFYAMKKGALASGALGAGISGSGPSVFALCRGEASARKVMESMSRVMHGEGVGFKAYLSPVSSRGAEIC
jgi:homoserine kinase